MKKFLIIAALLCGTAQASPFVKFCSNAAELAVNTTELANLGVTWKEIQAHDVPMPNMTKMERRLWNLSDGVVQRAYYSWSNLDSKTVRVLAFTACESEMRRLVQ